VFVEVRTRTGTGFGSAGESVGPHKQRQLRLMAEQYLQRHAPDAPARIDVVTVFLPPGGAARIEHIIDAV
jgi:putative endonuclease